MWWCVFWTVGVFFFVFFKPLKSISAVGCEEPYLHSVRTAHPAKLTSSTPLAVRKMPTTAAAFLLLKNVIYFVLIVLSEIAAASAFNLDDAGDLTIYFLMPHNFIFMCLVFV